MRQCRGLRVKQDGALGKGMVAIASSLLKLNWEIANSAYYVKTPLVKINSRIDNVVSLNLCVLVVFG